MKTWEESLLEQLDVVTKERDVLHAEHCMDLHRLFRYSEALMGIMAVANSWVITEDARHAPPKLRDITARARAALAGGGGEGK